MKRKATVSAADTSAAVKITIEVSGTTLTRDETTALLDDFKDDAMRTVARARFMSVPLSRIKVVG